MQMVRETRAPESDLAPALCVLEVLEVLEVYKLFVCISGFTTEKLLS